MGYCGSGGSSRRRALMDKFQQFLENIDESRAICPEGPCSNNGPCAAFGRSNMGQVAPMSTFNPPRAPDYQDPSKRPLITSTQVQEIRPTSDVKAVEAQDYSGSGSLLKLVDNLPKWEDRPVPRPASARLIRSILENKEKGYPPPGEKSPYLYRSPYPRPQELRPRSYPPECKDHRAEVPCKICDPPHDPNARPCPPEEDPSIYCPASWAPPCGHTSLSQAAGCPPIQDTRFVPRQLSPFHIPAFLPNFSDEPLDMQVWKILSDSETYGTQERNYHNDPVRNFSRMPDFGAFEAHFMSRNNQNRAMQDQFWPNPRSDQNRAMQDQFWPNPRSDQNRAMQDQFWPNPRSDQNRAMQDQFWPNPRSDQNRAMQDQFWPNPRSDQNRAMQDPFWPMPGSDQSWTTPDSPPYNPRPRSGTCGTCMDPKPPRTTCPSPCGEPCPQFHPVTMAGSTEPPDCKELYPRQPPCVDHYNAPCGAHSRVKNACEEYFGKLCKRHREYLV